MNGLVPYAGKSAERFPHSLEFDYLPLAKLLTGPGQYNWQPLEKSRKSSFTPDYEDERLIAALEEFIAALGQRYDSDTRVGFLTAGLLGFRARDPRLLGDG